LTGLSVLMGDAGGEAAVHDLRAADGRAKCTPAFAPAAEFDRVLSVMQEAQQPHHLSAAGVCGEAH
jgi:hypothetical protein